MSNLEQAMSNSFTWYILFTYFLSTISTSAFNKHDYDQQLFLNRIAFVFSLQRKSFRPENMNSAFNPNGILKALFESMNYHS